MMTNGEAILWAAYTGQGCPVEDRLCRHYLAEARASASRVRTPRRMDPDEVCFAMHDGLLTAVRSFDLTKGTPAVIWIGMKVRRMVQHRLRELTQGRRVHKDPDVIQLQVLREGFKHPSLVDPLSKHPADGMMRDEWWDKVTSCLPARLAVAVIMYHRGGKTLMDVGTNLGVCRERAGQLMTIAHNRMRERWEPHRQELMEGVV